MNQRRLTTWSCRIDVRFACSALVPMVETTDLRNRDDSAGARGFDGPRFRRVLLECQVRSGPMIIRAELTVDDSTSFAR
jgi:hypothetical protein